MNKNGGRLGPTRFALCIETGEHPARIIDDSGEDYLYPREYFQPLELTPFLSRLVRGHGGRRNKLRRPTRRPI
ncbi:MAG: hypothetical protein ABIY46_18570 [Gemmatimonadales bacterium]